MAFFDYPGTEGATTTERAPEVFLPEASDSDWSLLLRHCRRRHFDAGEAVISAGAMYAFPLPGRGRRSGGPAPEPKSGHRYATTSDHRGRGQRPRRDVIFR